MDNFPHNFRFLTANEQKLCTAYRELIGILCSITLYEDIIFGFDHLIFVFNEHEPLPS